MPLNRNNVWENIGYWLAEIVVVFLGVYLAFLLNGYRTQRQNEQKRQQIYTALYRYFSQLHLKKSNQYFHRKYVVNFLKPYRKKEMPRLKKPIRHLILSINDNTWQVMLQTGGFNLLNVKLINKINIFFSIIQREKEMTKHFNRMTDKYLLPHYHADISRFYDTKTKKLKPQYEWYVNYITFTRDKNNLELRRANQILKILKQKMNQNQLQKIKADSTK